MKNYIRNTTRNTALAIVALPVLMSSVSVAAEFDYDYIQLGVDKVDVGFGQLDIEKTDLTAFTVIGSYSINENVVVGGGYTIASGDTSGVLRTDTGNFRDSIDIESSAIGVFAMYHAALNDKADYQIGADFAQIDFESKSSNGTKLNNASNDDDSKGLFAGVRYQYNDRIELNAGASYDLDADDDEFGYDFGARYDLDSSLQLGFDVDPSGDETMIGINIRKYL